MSGIVRPRHAASLILLRGAGREAQVLMGRRPRKSRFAPDVFVFPGGAVDAADRERPRRLSPLCARLTHAPGRLAGALAAAAVRETFEETGLSLPDTAPLTLAARAITPTNSPVRFHARFFKADAADATGTLADSDELSELAFRPLPEARRLPLFDITEAVLDALMAGGPPFLFTYRYGKARLKTLI
ncbi:MAG TPA: NUDIX hydrolase [Caulobacter sp.]|nr:NUDIX hydrolase [Caulobacter sp.]